MKDLLPGIWRTHRSLFLLAWAITVALATFVVVTGGGVGAADTWWVPVAIIVIAGGVLTLGVVVPAKRVRRVLALCVAAIPEGHPQVVASGSDMVVRWPDLRFEVRGALGFMFILWHMKVRLPGEEWTFDTSAAPTVARYAQERFSERHEVIERGQEVAWGLKGWLPWVTPPFVSVAFVLIADLLGKGAWAFPVWAVATAAGYVLLLSGRWRTRTLVGRFVGGLRDHGRLVEGPYVVESALAPRYVLFTDRGPIMVQAIGLAPVGPLQLLVIQWSGSMVRARAHDLSAATAEVVRALEE